MSIEAMKQALEALCLTNNEIVPDDIEKQREVAIEALRQAIEQAEQKTEVSPDGGEGFIDGVWCCQCGKAYEVTFYRRHVPGRRICISIKPKGES
jgi:hypothetical protein